jgi:hypothetical protein
MNLAFSGDYKTGNIHFPKVSTGLIESENIYVLQEFIEENLDNASAPYENWSRQNLTGTLFTISPTGSTTGILTSDDSLFTSEFNVDDTDNILEIQGDFYRVYSITDDNTAVIEAVGATSVPLLEDISITQFLVPVKLGMPRTPIGASTAYLVAEIGSTSDEGFFLYTVDYTEDYPIIEKGMTVSISTETNRGYTGVYDNISVSGRVRRSIPSEYTSGNYPILPIQLNVGFSTEDEEIYEGKLNLYLDSNFEYGLTGSPSYVDDDTYRVLVSGTVANDYLGDISTVNIVTLGASGASGLSQNIELDVVDFGLTGSNTYLTVSLDEDETITAIGASSMLRFTLRNTLASIDLYAEAEGEDERLRLTLDNFGRKISEDSEYILRDSEISEERIDFRLLNRKRKELLLEGDSIYSYMGSYRSFLAVLDIFGYSDVRLKEYFLNVDVSSSDNGKFSSLLVPRTSEERELVKRAWRVLPSQVYKKTSLFGLYYDINRLTGDNDVDGLPEVEDAFQFTIEEVLIKLFSLKELLKREFLPLNARIYDITGEGIYFELVKLKSWNDNVQLLKIDLGRRPEFTIYPEDYGYIVDLRRIDDFYKERFYLYQGLTGFLGSTASDPGATSGVLPLGDWVGSYENYLSGDMSSPDPLWKHFPPSLANADFNLNASYEKPLADDTGIPIGAPVLFEAIFELYWKDADFTWEQASIFDTSLDPVNVNMWSWERIGRGQLFDMRWVVSKGGIDAFYHDTGRQPIENFEYTFVDSGGTASLIVVHALALPYVGEYDVALYTYDATNQFTVEYKKYEVKPSEADVSVIFKKIDLCTTWDNTTSSWKDISSPWTYPSIDNESTWENAGMNWDDFEADTYSEQSLFENTVNTSIVKIDREREYVILENSLLGYPGVTSGEFLFLERHSPAPTYQDWQITPAGLTGTTSSGYGTLYYDPTATGIDILPYTRILIKGSSGTSFTGMQYFYADVISVDDIGNSLTFFAEQAYIDLFKALGLTSSLYMDWGFLAGTYAIPVKTYGTTGSNTICYLNDEMKELYLIDANFSVKFASYDVDYAETRIGTSSLSYDFADETSWEEIPHQTWYSLLYLKGSNCGFIVPTVDSGGSIQIGEGEIFSFSGTASISSTRDGLTAAAQELLLSDNEYIKKFEYEVLPPEPKNLSGLTSSIIAGITYSAGATLLALPYVPQNLRVKAEVTATLQVGGTLSFSLVSGGCGYVVPPNFHVPGPGGSGATAVVACTMGPGYVSTVSASYGGTGYTSAPSVTVDNPYEFVEDETDWIWVGEWINVTSVTGGTVINLSTPLVSSIPVSTDFLLPYKYHKKVYLQPDIFSQYYWFIHARAKDPSSSNLFSVVFDNGVEGEWADHPERSYTLPLDNSMLYLAEGQNLHKDFRYNNWVYYGEDFPAAQNSENIFSSPGATEDTYRGPFVISTQSAFNFIETAATDFSASVKKYTPVVFTASRSRVPAKQSYLWSIVDDSDDSVVVMSDSKNFFWNFTRPGSYSVIVQIVDGNGNVSTKKHTGKVSVE